MRQLDALKEELKRPATMIAVILALAAVLVSIATSLYFYYKSMRVGHVYYQTQQVLVFDRGGLGDKTTNSGASLFIVDEQGHRIDNNVYAASVKIWNAGNDGIRRDDIRIPFKIELDGEAVVLSSSIYNSTMGNADGFTMSNELNIEWSNFDAGQGFAARLVYASNRMRDIHVVGFSVNSLTPTDADQEQETKKAMVIRYGIMLCVFWIIAILAYVAMRAFRATREPGGKRPTVHLIARIVTHERFVFLGLMPVNVGFLVFQGILWLIPTVSPPF